MKSARRVLIAQNSKNQSSIIEDSFAKDIDHFMTGVDAAVSINLWSSNTSPASLDAKDPTIAGLPFLPAKQGTVFRLCDFPPDATYMNRLDEILLNGEKITAEQKKQKHPMMHQVDALSYAIVLFGEITLIADNNQTVLKAGDVVVDLGSHHAWSNHTDTICRMAFVLIDAKR